MIPEENGWTKVTWAADTGAYDHIMSNEELPGHPISESEMSKRGEAYIGAGKEEIPNEGQTKVEGMLEGGQPAKLTVQRGRVHRNLAAIRRMVQSGNRVVFDQNEEGRNTSSIYNKSNGRITPIRLNGIYEFDMWVKKGQPGLSSMNRFSVLAKEEEETSSGINLKESFSRGCSSGSCCDPFHGHP